MRLLFSGTGRWFFLWLILMGGGGTCFLLPAQQTVYNSGISIEEGKWAFQGKPYTGRFVEHFYQTDRIWRITHFRNGLRHGADTTFLHSGEIRFIAKYDFGELISCETETGCPAQAGMDWEFKNCLPDAGSLRPEDASLDFRQQILQALDTLPKGPEWLTCYTYITCEGDAVGCWASYPYYPEITQAIGKALKQIQPKFIPFTQNGTRYGAAYGFVLHLVPDAEMPPLSVKIPNENQHTFEELGTKAHPIIHNGQLFTGYGFSLWGNGDTNNLIPYLNGLPHGKAYSYTHNKAVSHIYDWHFGIRGEVQVWHYLNQSMNRISFIHTRTVANDVKGFQVDYYSLGKSPQIFTSGKLYFGKRDGKWPKYFDNGTKWVLAEYEKDKPVGKWKYYSREGFKRGEVQYEEGVIKSGKLAEYLMNGTLTQITTYQNFQRNGWQKTFDLHSGKLRSKIWYENDEPTSKRQYWDQNSNRIPFPLDESLIFEQESVEAPHGGAGAISGEMQLYDAVDPVGAHILLYDERGNFHSGSMANEKGHFSISNIPPGQYFLAAKYIGYRELAKTPIQIKPGHEIRLKISLGDQGLGLH